MYLGDIGYCCPKINEYKSKKKKKKENLGMERSFSG